VACETPAPTLVDLEPIKKTTTLIRLEKGVLKNFSPNLSQNILYLSNAEQQFSKHICAILQNNFYMDMCLNTLSDTKQA
jgi:hypothetical protein